MLVLGRGIVLSYRLKDTDDSYRLKDTDDDYQLKDNDDDYRLKDTDDIVWCVVWLWNSLSFVLMVSVLVSGTSSSQEKEPVA